MSWLIRRRIPSSIGALASKFPLEKLLSFSVFELKIPVDRFSVAENGFRKVRDTASLTFESWDTNHSTKNSAIIAVTKSA